MEGTVFLGQNLIWVMLLMGQLHGYKSCIDKERNALFELRKYMISRTEEDQSDSVLPTWTNDTTSDCCRWKGVACNRVSRRVTEIAFGGLNLKDNSLLNLSLLHPFEDVRSLNLSSGEIPVEFGDLLKLQALNLSHNNLSGVIPESFSGLKNVESLDLSFNRLQGRIPPELTELSSLAVFNVSFNNLSGVVPQGRQFNTFDTQSYFGNPFLCGQPTNTSCKSNNFEEPDNGVEADESTIDMVSFYWSFAAAYVTIILGILASLSFDSPWSRTWFYIVDCFIHKVSPSNL